MKTIKLFFFVLVLILLRTTAFAQDEFYNEPVNNITEIVAADLDSLNNNKEDNYVTEKDYLDKEFSQEEIDEYEEELRQKEREDKRRRRNRADFAAEVIFEVIVNTAFIVVAFWQ